MKFTSLVEQPRCLLWLSVGIFVLLHLYRLAAPPNGYHAWRESDTAAVILNYYQEDADVLSPRINQRGASTGITGQELPLYNYAAALLYKAFGPSHVWPRMLTIAAGIVSLLLLFAITARLADESTAVLASWALAFSPLVMYYSFKIMPDMLMLMFYLLAMWGYLKYRSAKSGSAWVVSLVALATAAVIKPLVLCIFLVWAYLWWIDGRRPWQLAVLGLYIVIVLTMTVAWFGYARHLNTIHQTPGFYLGENMSNFAQYVLSANFFKKLFLQWPWELWIGWALVPAFLFGVLKWHRYRIAFGIALVWIVGVYLVFVVTAQHSASHDYYTLVMVPPLAIISGLGLRSLLDGPRWKSILLTVLLVAAPLSAATRVGFRFTDESDFDRIRADAESHLPRGELVMVQDPTQSIRLYQLNRTGWPLRFEITADTLRWRIEQGARYVILEKPWHTYDRSIAKLIDTSAIGIGPWLAYRVHEIH